MLVEALTESSTLEKIDRVKLAVWGPPLMWLLVFRLALHRLFKLRCPICGGKIVKLPFFSVREVKCDQCGFRKDRLKPVDARS